VKSGEDHSYCNRDGGIVNPEVKLKVVSGVRRYGFVIRGGVGDGMSFN